MSMTCENFEELMHLYLDGELSEQLGVSFEAHMKVCKSCRCKYVAFSKIIMDLRESYATSSLVLNKPVEREVANQEDTDICISAYVDNELDMTDTVKVRKMVVGHPNLRNKIEKIYSLQDLLKESFKNTQPSKDYSRGLLSEIFSEGFISNNRDSIIMILTFLVLSIFWVVLLVSIIL